MKALGLLLGAGVLALAAGQADATVSLYIGSSANGPATLTTGGPNTIYSNVDGNLYYNGKPNGFGVTVNASGAPSAPLPQLLTNSINIASGGAGSITLYIVQDMVTTAATALLSSFTSNTITGMGNSATLSTYYSATNPFATGTLNATALSEVTFDKGGLGAFAETKSLNGVTQPFYEVAKYTVDFKNAGTVNNTINLTAAGAVPEPASWAMMLMGFGLMGYALRQRRTAKVSFG